MGKFLNVLTSQEFNEKVETIETDYNHYLMDYIRDENRIPVEDISQLTNRINYDYNEMVNIYEYALDKVPLLYSLMHSNTGKFGTNNKASIVNEENIKNTFQINFNRDGYAANTGEEDLYDLTRLSPKPDWYANHLLMRIWQDTGESLAYQYGDEENLNYWDINLGQPEFLKDTIILTSPPEKEGILFLKNNELKNQELSVDLLGKRLGDQTVYLRAKKDLSSYISVSLSNNELLVVERKSGKENVLFSKELKDDNGEDKDDNKEDKENGVNKEDGEDKENGDNKKDGEDKENGETNSVDNTYEEGNQDNIEKQSQLANKISNGIIKISLVEDKLTLWLNGNMVLDNLKVTHLEKGSIGLGAKASMEAFDSGLVDDTIYDGVFKNMVALSFDTDEIITIIDMKLEGIDRFVNNLKEVGIKILQWFIENL
jgi:hypothetical protein